MTKGVELASAYVSLAVSTDGIPAQVRKALNGSTKDATQAGTRMGTAYANAIGATASSGMTGHGRTAAARFGEGFQSDAERRGAKVGTAVGTVIGKGIGAAITLAMTAATAGVTAAIGGLSYTLFKGFDRYRSLDATAKRLQAMGKTAEQVKSIMADVNEVIEGTPIALDAASEAATNFITAGMEGKDLKKTLTAIADAAGASGANFDELATIFGQVNNKGKLMGEEIAQLAEHGLNVMPLLREEFKNLPEDIGDAGLTLADLVTVVEKRFGGMAQSAANTIDGALGQMQTAVARVGANFLSAIFGDPLSTTDGPGGMAEAINKVTEKINGLNTWVVSHKDEIKGFFTNASETVKNLAEDVKSVGTFLAEHKEIIVASAAVWAGWKAISVIAGVVENLKLMSSLFSKTIPASVAVTSGSFASLAGTLGPIAAMAAAILAVDPRQNLPGGSRSISDAAKNGDWGKVLFGQGWDWVKDFFNSGGGAPTGNTPGALDPTGATNPNNMNTGGALTPTTASVQDYLRNSLGFTGTIGGWREPDGYNEHSSGKALDVMVGSGSEGYGLLPNMLTRPGVQYVIWDRKMWYPDGSSKAYTGPNPHTDHLHVKTFDEGGWLPPGFTLVENATGKPELVLNPQQIQQTGVDPNTLLHGQAQGAAPGPAVGTDGAQQPTLDQLTRTEGFIPAGAGFSGKTGGGVAGSLINLGAEAIKGVIQTAADLGKMAASAATAAGSFGAGAAAGPAAGAGIQIGADIAKRGVQWGADMLNIGIGGLTEILSPFGAPRWLADVDPTAFIPQWGVQPVATTTSELAQQVPAAEQVAAAAPPMPPGDQHMPPGAPPGVPPAPGPAQPPTQPPVQPPPPPFNTNDPLNFLKTLMPFDTGGVLRPNSGAVNLTRRPEYVFTQAQFKAMEANASNNYGGGRNGIHVENLTVSDYSEMHREFRKLDRRSSRTQMQSKAGL